MAEVDCISIFENVPDSQERVSLIDQAAPDFKCELKQVSSQTEEPVSNAETLVRFVVDPFHIVEEDGKTRLNSSFFNDASTFGASSLRKERATASEYEAALEELITQKPLSADGTKKRLYGVVLIPVEVAKSVQHRIEIKENNKTEISLHRAFGVYATGLDKRPNHSDLMVNMRSQIKKSKANKAGENLTRLVQPNLMTVEEFKETVDLSRWAA